MGYTVTVNCENEKCAKKSAEKVPSVGSCPAGWILTRHMADSKQEPVSNTFCGPRCVIEYFYNFMETDTMDDIKVLEDEGEWDA